MTTEKLRNQKDNLARLMATENLTIVHKAIPTAYFDVKNRGLACPTFKDDISPALYDLFMGHEVGHALNTPYEGLHSTITENRTLKGYLNVVEDVRSEKAIKNKYQGLRTSFFKAYNELIDRNFFGIKGRDLQELSLIDKINLITKCGSRVDIILNTEEIRFLQMAEDCKTWEDVVKCAQAIYDWSKEHEQRDESDEAITMKMPDIDNEESDEEGEENSDTSDDETTDEESDSTDVSDSAGQEGGKGGDAPEIKGLTDGASYNSTQKMRDFNTDEIQYASIPKIDLKEVIVDYKTVMDVFNKTYSNPSGNSEQRFADTSLEELNNHFKDNKKVISYMVKEF